MTTTEWLMMFMGSAIVLPTTLTATQSKIIYQLDTDWTTVRNAASGGVLSGTYIGCSCNKDNSNFFRIDRSFIQFDFSSVVGTVTEAKLSFLGTAINTGVYVQSSSNNTGTITGNDYDDITGTVYGNDTNYTLDELSRRVYTVTLNSAALTEINNKGILRFIVRDYRDYNNTEPTSVESWGAYTILPTIKLTLAP